MLSILSIRWITEPEATGELDKGSQRNVQDGFVRSFGVANWWAPQGRYGKDTSFYVVNRNGNPVSMEELPGVFQEGCLYAEGGLVGMPFQTRKNSETTVSGFMLSLSYLREHSLFAVQDTTSTEWGYNNWVNTVQRVVYPNALKVREAEFVIPENVEWVRYIKSRDLLVFRAPSGVRVYVHGGVKSLENFTNTLAPQNIIDLLSASTLHAFTYNALSLSMYTGDPVGYTNALKALQGGLTTLPLNVLIGGKRQLKKRMKFETFDMRGIKEIPSPCYLVIE